MLPGQYYQDLIWSHCLESISYICYIQSITWTVIFSDEYEEWFGGLNKKDQTAIVTDLGVLEIMGPTLGRPYVDQVNDSHSQI